MNEEEIKGLLLDALYKWGLSTQILIWIEEMAELTKVLAKKERRINPSYNDQIEEELADVDICLEQMKIVFPGYEKYKMQKLERLKRLVEVS